MSAEANDKKRFIRIRGANENNLKNLSVDIPRDQFVVLTGLSGSGKSSLAFDTIYAEGQRRYMESLSSYARQFLGQMEKPDVESIEGLSPAISIDQKSTNRNPRSTVGTVTEIYDYFRLLYARVGIPHCPKCGREIKKQTVDQMVDAIMKLPERTKIQLLAPVVRGKKGRHEKVLDHAKKSGYVRARIDGNMYELTEEITLDKNIKHNIEIIVDRLAVKPGIEKRQSDSVENVLKIADGLMIVDVIDGEPMNFSQDFSCPDCGISIDEIQPRSFSFNNPFGACPVCFGRGYKMEFDVDLMIPDRSVSLNDGAITVMGWQSSNKEGSFTHAILEALVERNYEAPITTARHLAEQREISPFTRMALIFQACRNSSAAFLKTQPSTTKAAPERAFLHQKYMNHLIVSLKPVLASIIEQGIAQDLIRCADPVSLAEIVLIVLTVKMDNTLIPSTADEIEQTISALVSLLEKGTENPAGSLNFLMAQL